MTESDARRLCDALYMLGNCQIYTLSRRDTGEEAGLAIFPNKHTKIPSLDELVLKQSLQRGGETVSTTVSPMKKSEGLNKTLIHDVPITQLSPININSLKLPLTLSITPSSVNTKCPTSRSSQQRIIADCTKPFVSEALVSPKQEKAYDEGKDTKVEMVTLKAVTKDEDAFAIPGQQVRFLRDWMSEQSTKVGAEIKKKGKMLCTLCNKFFTAKYLQKHKKTMHGVEYPDTIKVESSIEKNSPKDENDYILPSPDVENKVEDYTFLSDVENGFVLEEKYRQELGAIGEDDKIVATTPKKLAQSSKSKGERSGAGVSRQQPPKKIKRSLEKHPLQDFIAIEENLSNNLAHFVKESTHPEYLETEPATKKKKNRGTVTCDRLILNKDTIDVDTNIDMKVVGNDDNSSEFSDVLGVGLESKGVKLSENDLSGKSQDVGLDTSGAISACLKSPSDNNSIRRSRRLMQNQKKEVAVNGSSSKKSQASYKNKTIQNLNSNSNNSSVPKHLDSLLVSNLTESRNSNTDGGMSVTNTREGSAVTFIRKEFDRGPLECADRKMAQHVYETSMAFLTFKERETEKSNVSEESIKNNLLGHLAFQQNQEKVLNDENRTETNDSAVEVESKEILKDNYRTTLKPEIEGVNHLFSKTDSRGSAEMLNVYGLNEGKKNESPDETARSLGIAAFDEKAVLKFTPKCVKSGIFVANTDAEGSSPPQSSVYLYPGTPFPTLLEHHSNPEVVNNQPKSRSEMPLESSSQPPISPARVSFTMKAQGSLIPTGRTKLSFHLSMKPNVPLIKGMLAFKEEIQAGVEELMFVCEGKVLEGAVLVNEVKGKVVLVSKRDELHIPVEITPLKVT